MTDKQQCTSCQTGGAFTDVSAADNDNNVVVYDVEKRTAAGERPYCIVICAHTWCRPLCTKPSNPSAVNTDAAAAPNTTDLLASTNAQADRLGFEMQPGTIAVVLGEPKVNRCAWLCSAISLQCMQKCWTEGSGARQPVLSGGAPRADTDGERLRECRVVDKGDALRAVVCAVPEDGIEPFAGQEDFNWDNTQCTLYDRELDRRLWLACRRV